jgi:hypothetical protein
MWAWVQNTERILLVTKTQIFCYDAGEGESGMARK